MKLRIPDEQLEIGDVAVHGEEAYPSEDLVSVGSSMADESVTDGAGAGEGGHVADDA